MKKYVAVNFSFDERTDKVECVANKDMTITGENGAIVTLKKGEKFTAVRAASLGANMWYIVRQVSGEKKCSCPATKPCRHEKMVATSKVGKSDESTTVTAVIACVKQAPKLLRAVAYTTDVSKLGNLNTSRAFSLMR